jgi:hypothetical protein
LKVKKLVTMEEIAQYAFMAFVAIAVIAGLVVGYMAYDADNTYPLGFADEDVADSRGYVTLIMLVLGIIVGLVSITAKEVRPFLIAAIALMVARIGIGTTADVWLPLGEVHMLFPYWATEILNYIVAFAAPAAVLISIRSIWALAREK